jgi:hypothetical protein
MDGSNLPHILTLLSRRRLPPSLVQNANIKSSSKASVQPLENDEAPADGFSAAGVSRI